MANDWREVVEEVLALQDDPDIKTSPGPALQWYPAQWLGDSAVQLMSMEARGVHHHLLMTAWKGFAVEGDAVPCSVPADVEMLKAICLHPAGWESIWPQVARGWRELGGRLWNLGLCREYLRQMAKRRSSKGSADARWQRSQPGNNANASKTNANASSKDAKGSKRECSSIFSLQSSSSAAEEDPPLPPEGGDPSAPRQKKLPRKTTAADVERELVIPAELLKAGIDAEAVAERVRTCKALKHIETWQKELDRLAPLVAELGPEVVLETWRDAIASEWQGCTPEMARAKGRRNGGKPVHGKDRRFAQPHTTAPGSTGKDHGIDF